VFGRQHQARPKPLAIKRTSKLSLGLKKRDRAALLNPGRQPNTGRDVSDSLRVDRLLKISQTLDYPTEARTVFLLCFSVRRASEPSACSSGMGLSACYRESLVKDGQIS
jgi:hypothetical protein